MLSAVAGLTVHQTMLDVTGNNLANANTNGFKSSRVTFAETLSNTIAEATQPTENVGGTNPQQIGSGVAISTVDRDMTQGNLVNTGKALDMAIDGEGYFVLNDGDSDVFTRVGAFAVDSDYYLVDPSTGYRVQRTGSEGESGGFQDGASSDIRIPYDVALPASATTLMGYTGNLSSDEYDPSTNQLTSGIQYTSDGSVASQDLHMDELDQGTGLTAGDTITIHGTKRDGTELGGGAGITINLHDGSDFLTLQELADEITTAYQIAGDDTSVASVVNGEIRLTDVESGYSQADMSLSYSGAGELELPSYFRMLSAGGETAHNTNIQVYDTQGVAHTLSASFVRSDTANTWDLVLTSITGDVELVDRRISGITFLADGSFGGLDPVVGDTSSFEMTFGHDAASVRTIDVDLGTVGEFDGLSQFGGGSTASQSGQDGYASGWLSSISVSSEGILQGIFTNGLRRDLAAVEIATFQNAAGMQSIGNNYFVATSNSGDPVSSKGMEGNAGSITGGALEESNVEVSEQFVNLIEAQNGFQASARTIRVANDVLQELTNLVR